MSQTGGAGHREHQEIIIVRRKKGHEDGHHGGVWKIAFADFMTAMMAFFLLMWLLNATTEKQRKGIADFFSPTIPVNRISGGGEDVFGGDSVFTEETLARNGTGATDPRPTRTVRPGGSTTRAREATEMTMALRGPTFMNSWGPCRTGWMRRSTTQSSTERTSNRQRA